MLGNKKKDSALRVNAVRKKKSVLIKCASKVIKKYGEKIHHKQFIFCHNLFSSLFFFF